MKKTLELICKQCNTIFVKELKEYTRQTKHGKTNFFCSRRCTGLYNTTNLPAPENNPWCHNKTHLQRMRQLSIKKIKYSNDERPFYTLLKRTFNRYMKENDLDINYIKELWYKQQGRCAITNIPLELKGENFNVKASIDRIDSALGYVKGNIQIVSCAMNWAKNNSSNQTAKDFISLIVKYNT